MYRVESSFFPFFLVRLRVLVFILWYRLLLNRDKTTNGYSVTGLQKEFGPRGHEYTQRGKSLQSKVANFSIIHNTEEFKCLCSSCYSFECKKYLAKLKAIIAVLPLLSVRISMWLGTARVVDVFKIIYIEVCYIMQQELTATRLLKTISRFSINDLQGTDSR